jgi:hypothetical protein
MLKIGDKLLNRKSVIPIGGLEVYFMGVLLFSKEKSKLWPNVLKIGQKCGNCYNDYIYGSSIAPYQYAVKIKGQRYINYE